MFVFAFFITRRNASQSGEGKKECEEKHFIDHRYWLPAMKLIGITGISVLPKPRFLKRSSTSKTDNI
ncbi:hypothetical protein B4900_18490 [Yersinia rohdei]|nr:hypothetical protein B4900_18490 [Yersinia rohdei]